MPLGRLFRESTHVVLGNVVAVADEGSSTEVATVHVAGVVAGPSGFGPDVRVKGTPTDPEGNGFHTGQRLVLFLTDPLPSRPGVFDITDGAGVFGLPGGDIMELFDALCDHRETIRTVLVRDEGQASVMAEAYGRLTGKPGRLPTGWPRNRLTAARWPSGATWLALASGR